MIDVFSYYKEIKAADNVAIFNGLLDILTGMYKWEGLPDTIRTEYIELYLRLYGQCAIVPDKNGDYIAAMVNRGGAPDVYGLGTTPIISTQNGYTEQYNEVINDVLYGRDGRRGVIIYNNNTKSADMMLTIFTRHLTEAITSFYQNIIHSRYNPVFVAADDIIKRAIENSMVDIVAGKPVVIVADSIYNEIETGVRTLEIVPITDVDKQEKIQFISKTIDDLLRWFLSFYGQAIQGNGKLAQQTVDEVNGATSASFIIPEIGLRWRERACDMMRNTLDINATVGYNKPWYTEIDKYTGEAEKGENELAEASDSIEENEEGGKNEA